MAGTSSRGERGIALVAVAFFALIALAYVSSTLTSSIAVHNQARYYTAAQRANEACSILGPHARPLSTSHSRALRPLLAVANKRPSGLKESRCTMPKRCRMRFVAVPVSGAQTRTVKSLVAVANCPVGLNARHMPGSLATYGLPDAD